MWTSELLIIDLYTVLHHSLTGVTCLVTTGESKFYSSGLDVSTESLLKHDAHQIAADMGLLHTLLARLLTFPIPTIATISGLIANSTM